MTTILQKKKKQLDTKFKSKFEEDVSKFYSITDKYETNKIEYVLKNTYTPDFELKENSYLECKGFFKPSDRRKMLEVIKQHPNKRFIMLFQDSNVKLTRKSKVIPMSSFSKRNQGSKSKKAKITVTASEVRLRLKTTSIPKEIMRAKG